MTQNPNSKFYQICEKMILLSHQRQPARKQNYGFLELKLKEFPQKLSHYVTQEPSYVPSPQASPTNQYFIIFDSY